MPYKKDGVLIVEYRIIPEHQQLIRELTVEQFAKLENDLKLEVAKDPAAIGQDIIREHQAKLDDVLASKSGMENPQE